jgi:ferredoxin
MIPIIDKDSCTGCGSCLEACPPLAIIMSDEKALIETEFCEECGFCAAECPVGAISIPYPTGEGK